MWNRLASAGLAIALAGCASPYKGPPGSADAAIIFHHNGGVHNYYAGQVVFKAADAGCSKKIQASYFLGLDIYKQGQVKSFRVPSAEPLYLVAQSTLDPNPMDRTELRCTTVTSFVPEPGHSYDYTPTSEGRRCWAKVVDRATGLPPAGMTDHGAPALCTL